jgi:hypothetical protein
MQSIKNYSPMVTGLAYLPFAIGIGLGSGGADAAAAGPHLPARRCGHRHGGGRHAYVWFSLLTPDQNTLAVLLPAQLVAGVGLRIGFVAATIGGVQNVAPKDSGAFGPVNTSQQIGGALGLAILASAAVTATGNEPAATATVERSPRLHRRPARRRRLLPRRHPPHAATPWPQQPATDHTRKGAQLSRVT